MLFCSTCNNLLNIITSSSSFYFKCDRCAKNYEPTDDDSLRFDQTKETDFLIYKSILRNAGKDPVNPKYNEKCHKCENSIVKRVMLGNEMRLISVCTKCSTQWVFNS